MITSPFRVKVFFYLYYQTPFFGKDMIFITETHEIKIKQKKLKNICIHFSTLLTVSYLDSIISNFFFGSSLPRISRILSELQASSPSPKTFSNSRN